MNKMVVLDSEKIDQIRQEAYQDLTALTTYPEKLLGSLDKELLTEQDITDFSDSLGLIESRILKIMRDFQELGSLYSLEMDKLLIESHEANASLKAEVNPNNGIECKAPYTGIKQNLEIIKSNGHEIKSELGKL